MDRFLSLPYARQPQRTVSFAEKARYASGQDLRATDITVLQVNLGYRCNMTCGHCHVDAGPGRTEVMDESTADAVLGVLRSLPVATLDLTGGAPEMHPHFRVMVRAARKAGKRVVVRTNLTVLLEPDSGDLPGFFRTEDVELIASLPCYLEQNVDAARGTGAYRRSIEALKLLNRTGYGMEGGPALSLVYNPGGPFLPPNQQSLEADYRRELLARHGISFSKLYTFTNMPIGRYRRQLERAGEFAKYQAMLSGAFNPATLDRLMCRTMVSVGWDGRLYDCDFNQVLGVPVRSGAHGTIGRFDLDALSRRVINVDDHCYGCTAGQGSS